MEFVRIVIESPKELAYEMDPLGPFEKETKKFWLRVPESEPLQIITVIPKNKK
jgi:hypothetical protein